MACLCYILDNTQIKSLDIHIHPSTRMFSSVLKQWVDACLWISRWIVQAMKHELKIRAGDMPPQDIHQLSPSDIKQLLLDVLQPQHTARFSHSFKLTLTLSTRLKRISYPCCL